MSNNYGFIITRHVNSEKTNKYWNRCVKLIKIHYPDKPIVVIDDNSNTQFVNIEHNYDNITYIQSEWPGRGELLPYVYYLRHKWFPNAVIIHDSLFIHSKINFDLFGMNVMPLWHHNYDKENLPNIVRIASALTNNQILKKKLTNEFQLLGLNTDKFSLCFGCQSYIKLNFLEHLQRKYNITNLVNVIHCRSDRCALERVMGLLFCQEYAPLNHMSSLFGDILTKYRNSVYTYDEYIEDFKNKRLRYPFIKVWTGR